MANSFIAFISVTRICAKNTTDFLYADKLFINNSGVLRFQWLIIFTCDGSFRIVPAFTKSKQMVAVACAGAGGFKKNKIKQRASFQPQPGP
jgi:hypothetical protein